MIFLACLALLVATTLIHYEVLRGLSASLPGFRIPVRTKLIFVIFGTFLAHALEIMLYAVMIFVMSRHMGWGTLGEVEKVSLRVCMYFSAETFTSLGFGDIVPRGGLRLLSGAEALNGLLLIGWSASYIYISMERFWGEETASGKSVADNARVESGSPASILVRRGVNDECHEHAGKNQGRAYRPEIQPALIERLGQNVPKSRAKWTSQHECNPEQQDD